MSAIEHHRNVDGDFFARILQEAIDVFVQPEALRRYLEAGFCGRVYVQFVLCYGSHQILRNLGSIWLSGGSFVRVRAVDNRRPDLTMGIERPSVSIRSGDSRRKASVALRGNEKYTPGNAG